MAKFAFVLGVLVTTLMLSWTIGAAELDEQQFRKALGLTDYQVISCKDADDRPISLEQFAQLMSAGKSFSMDKSSDKSRVVLKLDKNDKPASSSGIAKLKVELGAIMPVLTLPDLDGVVHRFGRPGKRGLLLDFYFADCAPCVAEVPMLNAFAAMHPDIDVVAVTFDAAAIAREFITKRGLQWPVVADAQEYIKGIGVRAFPTLALVGTDGKLLGVHTGGKIDMKTGEPGVDQMKWVNDLLEHR